MTEIPYQRVGDGIGYRFPSPANDGVHLVIFATHIRIEAGMPKAHIELGISKQDRIAADDLKLLASEERLRLANKAALALWGSGRTDKKAIALDAELMNFCLGLWKFNVGSQSGSWVEGDAEPSAPNWAVPGMILVDSTSINFGNAGAGKSTLYRIVAQSLCYDIAVVIPIQQAADVIWVNAEESPDEHRRQIGNVNAALGLERTAPLYTVDARGMPMADVAPRIERAIAATGAKHVFIDSLSRLAQGLSLNENATATLLVDSVAGMGASMNWIGHTGQENENRLSGSKHFTNAARLMVRVQARQSIGGVSPDLRRGVRVSVMKGNGIATGDELYFTTEYHRDYGLVRVERADAGEWPPLRCDMRVGNGQCRRLTWDGIFRGGVIRCGRHRDDDVDGG